jgi:hypothetical protein
MTYEEEPLPEQIDHLFERTDAKVFSILSEIVEIVRESSEPQIKEEPLQ